MNIKEIDNYEKFKYFINNNGNINQLIPHKSGELNFLFFIILENQKSLSREFLKEIIKSGIDINHVNSQNENVLFYVENKECAEILLQAGININQKNLHKENPLMLNSLIPLEVMKIYAQYGMSFSEKESGDRDMDYFQSLCSPFQEKDFIERIKLGIEYYDTGLPESIIEVLFCIAKNKYDLEKNSEIVKDIMIKISRNNFDFALHTDRFVSFYEAYKHSKIINDYSFDSKKDVLERNNMIFKETYISLMKRKDNNAKHFIENFMLKYIDSVLLSEIERNVLTDNSLKINKKSALSTRI